MTLKTPDYALTEDYTYSEGMYDKKTVPAGTFVRPIEIQYVPKHITADERWRHIDKEKFIYCYFRGGIVPFPRDIVRQK